MKTEDSIRMPADHGQSVTAGRRAPPPLSLLLPLILLLGLNPTASATTAAGEAEARIRQGTGHLLQTLSLEYTALSSDARLTRRRVAEILTPYVDFDTIGRLLLGRHWRQADLDQRERFIAEFKTLMLRSYATALVEFVVRRGLDPDDIEYQSTVATPDGRRALVRTRLRMPQGPPVQIHYSMRLSDGEWKIYDVSVDAVSLVSTYRSSFSQEIDRAGLTALIARLTEHNRQP